ncbi:hypothetical protein UFOVP33_72 [uncultured Caudovirales phage]|uniref:Uncharacterized protein n=1 Tax=uncultured Caudovirales phage TaxID=2100421 RepID=A0A6J5KMA9_9CAUD|nr:hypothetical protein UFOVP33_72 [uncultured Caudovirales phage]
MGTITTASILTKAAKLLQDTTGVRWDNTELLGWLNSGQRETMIYKPNSNVKALAWKLAAGTRQSLPADAVQLIDVVRNMGTDGNTPGRAIRQTERETLDASFPNWHATSPNAVIKHFMFNPLDPKNFYVYPPQPAANQGYAEVLYGAVPANATSDGSITVDDIYETVLLDYILYRAFSKDSEYADQTKADKYQTSFITALTGKARVEAGANPNVTAPANTVTVA